MPVVKWKIHIGFILLYFHHFLLGVFNQLWEMENGTEILPYGTPFSDINKPLKFCDWNWKLCSCTTVNLSIDSPITLSSDQPYWSINRQDVRLKSSPISPRGLIGAEGQETCMFLLVYCLYGSNKSGECVCVPAVEQFSFSCVLPPFSHFRTCYLFFFFMISPKTNSNVCYLQVTRQWETY